MRGTLNFKSLSHLSSNLVAALTSLNVNDFPHFSFFLVFLHSRRKIRLVLGWTELVRLCSARVILIWSKGRCMRSLSSGDTVEPNVKNPPKIKLWNLWNWQINRQRFDCKTHPSETERDVNLLKFRHLGPLWAWLCSGPGFSK